MARAGRRPGQTETRETILAAARTLFAEQGYDATTVRGIATAAGVNPALLHHFFGTKQQVFVAAMELPVNPAGIVAQLMEGPPEAVGERLVRMFLQVWGDPAGQAPFLALLRSATTNEHASTMMREFMERAVLAEVARLNGIPRVRVAAAAAQLMGIALLRYVVQVPALANATDEDLVALLAPTIQRYLQPE
jgi:AcrR family transcriptional regulator